MKKDCKAEKKCKECPGLHHTALHSVKKTSAAASSSSDSTSGSAKPTPTPAAASTSASVIATQAYLLANPSRSKHIFLMTATIWIENGKGLRREAMCLIDGGSQRTYIRRSFALENGLITVGIEILAIQAFGSSEPGEAKERNRWSIIIRGMFPNARGIAMTVVEDDDICPAPEYKRTKFAQELHDSGNHLADSRFFDEDPKESMVDILIGSEHYYSIIEDHTRRSSSEGFRAVPSKLGWLSMDLHQLNQVRNLVALIQPLFLAWTCPTLKSWMSVWLSQLLHQSLSQCLLLQHPLKQLAFR